MMSLPLVSMELIYTLLIVFLCVFVYFKTKDLYGLTKHAGIGYFRNAFLFFALAYLFRLIFILFKFSWFIFDSTFLKGFFWPLNLLLIGYLGTMAILSLMSSTIWKEIKIKHLTLLTHAVALVIALLSLLTLSIYVILFSHLAIILFTLIVSYLNHKKRGKFTNLFVIYLLLFVFWLINILILGPKTFFPFEVKIFFYLVSSLIFLLIFNKVMKWTK